MSHSTAAVRFPDGTILHGEFNGTSDVLLTNLYLTQEERQSHWRKQKWTRCENKSHRHEQVEVAVSYGNGWHWNAIACRECMVVIEPLSLENMSTEEDTQFPFPKDGLPDWYPNRELYHDYRSIK